MFDMNYNQLLLMRKNTPHTKLEKLVSYEHFHISFLQHLKEHFQLTTFSLNWKQPIFDAFEEQQTTLCLDEVEIGDIYLKINSLEERCSLVYLSPSELLETTIIDYYDYASLSISDYFLLLAEFAYLLLGVKKSVG